MPLAAFMLLFLGVLIFTQVTVGGAVDRLLSYTDDIEPDNAGPRGSAFRPRPKRRSKLSDLFTISATVKRGDPRVLEVIAPAVVAVGARFRVISWHRPGSFVNGNPATPSCHRFGAGTSRGAVDLVPLEGGWTKADQLVAELRQTPGVGEVVFRGDPDHDPALGATSSPHVHVAVGCG
jgi:hypothetical protein